MCDFGQQHDHSPKDLGFLVDAPEIRALVDETRRLTAEISDTAARLEVARRQTVKRGQFYSLLPPLDDIHYVKAVSKIPSISIHLLANDTACVTRHRFDAAGGVVTTFRSGYSNAKCEDAQ